MSRGVAGARPSPFDHNHADPWAKNPIDLPSLNARASDAIIGAIDDVRDAARSGGDDLRSTSILFLGSAGAGKTHLFARLRRKLGPRAVFVHLRPLVGTEMTPRYVLGEIVRQLGFDTATDGVSFRQLDALVGAALAQLRGESPNMPRAFLDLCASMDAGKREELLAQAVEQLLERHQEIDETYLARLLATPFMPGPTSRAALAWLGGRELEEGQLGRLGVAGSLREERIIEALQTLGVVAAPGAPIVLVFDQLENLVDPESTGSRVRAYANLIAELFDTLRGFVIVQMALDTEWQAAIAPELSEAQKTRLAGRTELVALPKPDEARELIRLWAEQLPEHPEPFPWPFGARRVARWCDTPGMTPRMLMIACREALAEGPGDDPEEADAAGAARQSAATLDEADATRDALEASWDDHLRRARALLDEASAERRGADLPKLVGGLVGALRFTPGVKVTRVDGRAALQVEADTSAGPVAVCFLHQTHPRSAVGALDKAAAAGAGPRPRGLVVIRERAQEFPPTWKQTLARQEALLRAGARWVVLERDDAAKLLALESLLAAARSRDVEGARGRAIDEQEVTRWVAEELAVATWAPLQAVAGGAGPRGGEAPPPPSEPALRDAPTAPRPSEARPATERSRDDDTAATIVACLARLRVASLDRLVREVARVRPATTRTEVVAVLDKMSDGVTWFGRAILSFSARARERARGAAPRSTRGER